MKIGNTPFVQARFLLGPAGSGKTHRCLAEIRAELLASPDGPLLILLAPKQATFQLERQLLADPEITGYTRLRILSFERLAQFVLDELHVAPPTMLSEEGRVMVLRALLIQHQKELKIFHASARLNGFAQQLSALLREFQHHRLSVDKLLSLVANSDAPAQLRDKLHDLALLLAAYNQWLKTRALYDANSLLDVAVDALNVPSPKSQVPGCGLCIARVWLDGFAEMTPQELDLLAAFLPSSENATLAFCLEREPEGEQSWLSTWSVVAQTFRRCHARIAAIEGCRVTVETFENKSAPGRFARSEILGDVEANWSKQPASERSEVRDSTSQIRIAVCHDPESEAVLAAREILCHVRAGGRFRDCGVILRSLDAYHATLDRVFRRYDIPFFMDRRKAAAHHPLAELTRYALRTVAYDWRHDDWFGALKSGLVVANEGAIDQLENDALANGWEGKTWREPLPVDHLEKVRQFIMPPFKRFAVAVSGNVLTGKQLAEAVVALWRDLEVESQLDHWSDATRGSSGLHVPSSVFYQGVLEQMRDVLGNLARAFPDAGLSLHEWLPVFEAGLSGLTVGVIPPALDQVLIGAIDRSRNPDLKLALVLGLNEGVFPAPPVPGTLLTEMDRAGLERADVYLGPTPRQRIGHERYFGYIACTRASERLVLTCAAEDGKGKVLNPSPFVAHVCRIAGAKEETFNAAGQWWMGEHASEIAAPLLKMRTDVAGLAELPAIRPVVEKWRQVEAAAVVSLPPAAVDLLFGTNLNTSVSALEDFAACPFRFFAARGLRLQERKEFEVDDRDRGNFHHDVLEEFHRRATMNSGRWRDLGVKVAVELVGQIAREELPIAARGKFQSDGAARFTGGILIERIQKLVAALIEWMPQYDFDPVGSEIAFEDGTHGALPAWKLDLGNGHSLSLRGRIDRVDLCRLPDGDALAVVMDYKSRVRRLDNTKLHHGLELQLLSYLGVLKQVGDLEKFPGVKTLRPTGVFYIPLNGGAGKAGTKRADIVKAHVMGVGSGAAAEGRAAYRHSGRFLADELIHFDNRNGNKGDQFVFKKKVDGTLAATGNEALPLAEFDALRTKVEEHLRDYGRRIFEGEVAVSPFRIGKKTACDYCDFRPVCRFDPWTQQFRQLRPPPKKSADSQDE